MRFFKSSYLLSHTINGDEYKIIMEGQYLNLMKDILKNAPPRSSRNGNVLSKFGAHLECDLADGFPLLTSKKMFWRGIVEELCWFLRGSTDVRELRSKRVHIWDGNSEDRNWDAGPVYGFQWRHFGEEYRGCDIEYSGIDQITNVIQQLKCSPGSRRIVLSAWNPLQQAEMCLPPCHVMYQFYVESDGRVSVQMYQRSSDVFLGLPFNIASTALLLKLICHYVEMKPGRVIIQIGDAHIYEEHISACREQLEAKQHPLPSVKLMRKNNDLLWNVRAEEIVLLNYVSENTIRAPMKA